MLICTKKINITNLLGGFEKQKDIVDMYWPSHLKATLKIIEVIIHNMLSIQYSSLKILVMILLIEPVLIIY